MNVAAARMLRPDRPTYRPRSRLPPAASHAAQDDTVDRRDVGGIDRIVAVDVACVEKSGVTIEDETVNSCYIGSIDRVVVVDVAHNSCFFLVRIQAHIHCLPFIVGVEPGVEQCNVEISILLSVPSPVYMHESVLVITVDNKIMSAKEALKHKA